MNGSNKWRLFLLFMACLASCRAGIVFIEPQELAGLSFDCYNINLRYGKQDWSDLFFNVSKYHFVNITEEKGESLIEGEIVLNFDPISYGVNKPTLLYFEKGELALKQRAIGVIDFLHLGWVGGPAITSFVPEGKSYPEIIHVMCDSPDIETIEKVALYTMNKTALVHMVSPDINPFLAMYDSLYYRVTFQAVIPMLYLSTAILGIYFVSERFGSELGLFDSSSYLPHIPVVVLVIESSTLLVLSFVLFFDCWFANLGIFSMDTRMFFLTNLSGSSLCTTFLIYAMLKDVLVFEPNELKSVYSRNKLKILLAFLNFWFDFFLFMNSNFAYHYQTTIGAYFSATMLFFGCMFLRITSSVASVMDIHISDQAKHASSLRSRARLSGFSMIAFVICAAILGFSKIARTAHGWYIIWVLMLPTRCAVSFTQIIMCRLPARFKVPSIKYVQGKSLSLKSFFN